MNCVTWFASQSKEVQQLGLRPFARQRHPERGWGRHALGKKGIAPDRKRKAIQQAIELLASVTLSGKGRGTVCHPAALINQCTG